MPLFVDIFRACSTRMKMDVSGVFLCVRMQRRVGIFRASNMHMKMDAGVMNAHALKPRKSPRA